MDLGQVYALVFVLSLVGMGIFSNLDLKVSSILQNVAAVMFVGSVIGCVWLAADLSVGFK